MKKGELIPREIVFFLDIALIIVLLLWAYEMIEYRHQLAEINGKQIERCYYIKCEADIFGGLHCVEERMPMNAIPIGDEERQYTFPINVTNITK